MSRLGAVRWWFVVVAVLLACPALGAAAPAGKKSRPPNVIIVYVDDMGYGDLGCYGSKNPTPNLDRMAMQGVRGTDFYVAQGVCSASRAALLTGRYSNRVGILGALGPANKNGIGKNERTLAQLLKTAGYATGIIGKWHLGHLPAYLPRLHGFDEYFGLPYSNDMWPKHPTAKFPDLPLIQGDRVIALNPDQSKLTTWYTEKAVDFIRRNQEQPFFLYVAHNMPHVPLFVSERHKGKSGRGLYGDVVMELDWSVGQILHALKEYGLDDHTLVIFASDNGPWLSYGNHAGSAGRLREGKGTTWEGGVRVPFVARWPGRIPAGTVFREPAMTIDLVPTVVKLAGAKLPNHKIDGKDIWPILSGQRGAKSPHEAYYFYWGNKLEAVRSGPWKLYFPHSYRTLAGQPGGQDGKPAPYQQAKAGLELYDLDADVSERTNVAARHLEVIQRLKRLADQMRADLGDGGKAVGAPEISADRIKADVAYLANDRLEGRGPGTRGELLATEYLADAFKKAGLKPIGKNGTYLQPVPLVRVVTSPQATLQAVKGETTLNLPLGDGFVGTSQTQKGLEAFDAEAIFCGHGITAPEFKWDDYQGTDVKGKVVVVFTNEPPSDDPKFFGGKALTYYGRWTYKFEEAARRGAKACFIIHTRETAGYPYYVVRTLEGAQLARDPGQPALAFAGWLSRAAGEQLLDLAGRTVDGALKEADTKGFKAYSLGVRLKGNFPTRVEKFVSKNVVGMVEGSDPTLKAEAVVFTAHWDHLGVGPAILGDTIYNGAADNATGCALLMELARAWSAQSPRPKRSAIFLAVTAEEKGLLGSMYYTENPLVPLGKTALNLNFDMILPLGVPESVVVTGAERTTAWPAVQAAAAKNLLEIEADQRAHLGIFYRSDHFSMAKAGVPAFSVSPGMKIKGKPKDFASKAYKDFNDHAYHTPQDEFRADWDFSGFVVLARFTLDVARAVANADGLPTWNPGDEFRAARDRHGVK